MKYLIFLYSICMAVNGLQATEINLKESISVYQKKILNSSKAESSNLKKDLALLYVKDQNLEKAFTTFLEALDIAKTEDVSQISAEEQQLYDQALNIYLDRTACSKESIAKEVIGQFEPILSLHPEYRALAFVVAASYANMEKFGEFFELFYRSYLYFPDHYLAHKGKAALHAQLMARLRIAEEREKQRQKILDHLQLAIQKYPLDTTLYKMVITFATEKKKEGFIITYLNKIIDANIIIPRADIAYFVQQAVEIKQIDLAESFLQRAKEWYEYSRVLEAAQKYIDKHKV